MPSCLAVIVTHPALKILILSPSTTAIERLELSYVTGKPELAVASAKTGADP
ncbi:hypothetical protein D3C79_1049570 [compost metagenome]